MAPDPDPGRLLAAAQARYQVRQLAPGELAVRRDEWANLLARSAADPLFCSPGWLLEWWAVHGAPAGLEPVFTAVERDGRLVGLALLSLARVMYRGLLPIRRLEMLGNGRHRGDFTMSEHMGFIIDRGEAPGVGASLLASLWDLPQWDELVIGHSDRGASTDRLLAEAANLHGGYLRRTDPMAAWRIELEGGLEGWRRSLGSATRDRIFGGRRRLERLGRVTQTVADAGSLERCLGILDGLHATRWGSPLFSGARGRLYRSIARSQVAQGHRHSIGARVRWPAGAVPGLGRHPESLTRRASPG